MRKLSVYDARNASCRNGVQYRPIFGDVFDAVV